MKTKAAQVLHCFQSDTYFENASICFFPLPFIYIIDYYFEYSGDLVQYIQFINALNVVSRFQFCKNI